MKTLANLLILLFGLSAFGFGQSEKPITEWINIDRPEDEFALEVPRGFEFGKWAYPNNKTEARGEFQSLSERFYLFIDTPQKPFQRRYAEDYLALHKQSGSDIDLAGRAARKAEFEDGTGYYHRIIFTQTATRVFTLHTVSRHKSNSDAIRFLNSFKLRPTTGADETAIRPAFGISELTSKTEPKDYSPLGSAQGAGRTGTGQNGTSQPQRTINGLKVVYRHNASYTDFARFYNIQGTVLLRVTFLASGEVGPIANIRTLPFGLTESAIYAAKQMRFEPETVNGVARTTSRPVSFSFSIY